MNNLGVALGWKYNNAEGICTKGGALTEWPVALGDMPTTQELQAIVDEYELAIAHSSARSSIKIELAKKLDTGFLWAWDINETQFSISLDQTMQVMFLSMNALLEKGEPSDHAGYIKSNGVKIKGPGGIDLPDAAVSEICTFAGKWALKISQIAIEQEDLCDAMTLAQLQVYDPTAIDWTVTWDALTYPDWTDDLCLYNPIV